MTTRDEAFAKLGQGHQLDEECKRIIAEEWGFNKVVRCKDCKHRPIDDHPPEDDDYTCPFICWNSYYTKDPDDDFFCKNGERKDSDSDADRKRKTSQ